MVAKLGFILLVLAFGMLMFLAGSVAPPAVRAPVEALFSDSDPGSVAPASAPSATPSTETAATPPTSYASLLLKSGAPAKGDYGIQLGLFAEAAAARPLSARVQRLGYAPEIIAVTDGEGSPWTVLAVGHYASPEEAETVRARLAQRLGESLPLPLLLLPTPKSSTPAAP